MYYILSADYPHKNNKTCNSMLIKEINFAHVYTAFIHLSQQALYFPLIIIKSMIDIYHER